MWITLLRAKLHRATVTDANIQYTGSISIDTNLLETSGMMAYEKVLVVDVENGQRFETYIIPAKAGSGAIQVNGAAARLVSIGDHVIIMAFAGVELPAPSDWKPRVVLLDAANHPTGLAAEDPGED
ncbi:MAG: aspartate 1-decarboxylase [Anaerolineaceae bacterium]